MSLVLVDYLCLRYFLGYLTKHDFQRLYQQFFPFGQVEPFAQIMFNMFDINRNGKLEFYEYTLALSITTRGKFTEKLKCKSFSLSLYYLPIDQMRSFCVGSFQLYDLDKDGLISRPEMLLVLESLYKLLAASRHRQEGLQIQETPLQRLEHLFALMDLVSKNPFFRKMY